MLTDEMVEKSVEYILEEPESSEDHKEDELVKFECGKDLLRVMNLEQSNHASARIASAR